ncbi:MAG: DUF4169 family protein [Beijerinckiaceae bacterium]
MSGIVNLRRWRKGKKREDAEARAAENRAAFGRTKAERELQAKRDELAARFVEGHRREPPDATPGPPRAGKPSPDA